MAACIWAIAREVPHVRYIASPLPVQPSPAGGTLRPEDEKQPRFGVILARVKRRRYTRGSRPRQAPDGRQSGGTQPTDIRVINRRDDWLLLLRWAGDKNAHVPSQPTLKTLDTGSHINGQASAARGFLRVGCMPGLGGSAPVAACSAWQEKRLPPQDALPLEFVERQPEAGDKRLQKVADFRQIEALHAGVERFLGVRKFRIPGCALL
jgi:hypothetical protein